mgnify:FL=1
MTLALERRGWAVMLLALLATLDARGWSDDLDIVFTTDHGEFQGDFGLLFKGPYHVDALMRLPLIWRPARSAGVAAATVTRPVGLVDLAPTFCQAAGVPSPDYVQGTALPVSDADADARRGEQRVLTEWDSELFGVDVHVRTLTRERWVVSVYGPGFSHDGSEGELYDLVDDPLQRHNLWDDPAHAALRSDLVADLWDHQPPTRTPRLAVMAPV